MNVDTVETIPIADTTLLPPRTESSPTKRADLHGSFGFSSNALSIMPCTSEPTPVAELTEIEKLIAALSDDVGNSSNRSTPYYAQKLLLQTLLLAAIPVAARFLLQHYTGFDGFVEIRDIGLVFTGLFFTAGVLFRTNLVDLHEAEKMPQEMANTLEWIEDIFLLMSRQAKADMQQVYHTMIRFVVEWKESIRYDTDHKVCLSTLSDLVRLASIWDAEKKAKGAQYVNAPLDRAKRVVVRAVVIRKTDVLPPAHALQQFFVLSATVLLFVTTYNHWATQVVIMLVINTVTWYNLRLLWFVDDPFVSEVPFGMSFLLGKLRQVHFFPLDEFAKRCVVRHRQWCDAKNAVYEVNLPTSITRDEVRPFSGDL